MRNRQPLAPVTVRFRHWHLERMWDQLDAFARDWTIVPAWKIRSRSWGYQLMRAPRAKY